MYFGKGLAVKQPVDTWKKEVVKIFWEKNSPPEKKQGNSIKKAKKPKPRSKEPNLTQPYNAL